MEIPEIEPEAERTEPTDAAAEGQRLADATFEPEAAVEQTSDFQQAEAIETAFVQAVEQTAGAGEGVSPPVPAPEGGERPMVAPIESGPEKILAEGIIGPAPRVEELPRDQEPHIPEGPAPSGSGEPVGITPINLPGPVETAMTGLTLDGKIGDLPSLDGKGNDLVDQPEYPKVEMGLGATPIESTFPKVELGSGLRAMETPDHKIDMSIPLPSIETPDQKIDMGVASPSLEAPDHKIETLPGSPSIESIFPKMEIAEGLEGKDPAYVKLEPEAFSWKVDRGLAETGFENLGPVLGRAVTDPQFRQQLAQEPEAALAGYSLSEAEHQLLKQIDPTRLEAIAGELQTRFGQVEDPAAQEVLGRQLGQLLWGTEG